MFHSNRDRIKRLIAGNVVTWICMIKAVSDLFCRALRAAVKRWFMMCIKVAQMFAFFMAKKCKSAHYHRIALWFPFSVLLFVSRRSITNKSRKIVLRAGDNNRHWMYCIQHGFPTCIVTVFFVWLMNGLICAATHNRISRVLRGEQWTAKRWW